MKKKIILVILILILILGGWIYIINKNKEKETISEYKYFVVKENNKYGVIDAQGNKVITEICEVMLWKNRNLRISRRRKVGFRDFSQNLRRLSGQTVTL